MTQAVATEGFNVPPAGGNPPPAHAQTPGFVPPAATAQPAVAPAVESPDLSAAIAALNAALGTVKSGTEQQAAPAATGGLNEFDVGSLDDPILRSMATVMQTVGKGLDLDRVLGKAIEHGDAGLVDVAYLREKAGDNAEQLITIAQGIVQAVEAKSSEITKSVHELTGGEANWDASVAAFNTSAPRELRMVVARMLDDKNSDTILAGAKIVAEFGKGSGLLPQVNASVQTGAAALPAAQALDKLQFQSELQKLDPNARDFVAKRSELFARRALGRKLGK